MTNRNVNGSASRTQVKAILAYLQDGKTLTGLEALDRFGCSRLAARIGDIKDAGYSIRSEMVTLPGGKRVAEYRLAGTVPQREKVERMVEPVQVGLGLDVAEDGPSWLSRRRWEL